MTPDDPRHGTYAGVQAHKRHGTEACPACVAARRKYQKRLDVDHARGRRRRISPAMATRHARRLLDGGVTAGWIAEQAGVARATIYRLLGTVGPIPDRIEASTVAKVLAVQLPDVPRRQGYLPRIGSVRRIEALNALGWSRSELAARLGTSPQTLTTMISGHRGVDVRPNAWVQAANWHRINDLYVELAMTPGPSRIARRRAREKGYVPPLAWDNIDDPDEQPTGWQYEPELYRKGSRKHVLEELVQAGGNISEACRRLKLSRDSLHAWCKRNDLSALYLNLTSREQRAGNGYAEEVA